MLSVPIIQSLSEFEKEHLLLKLDHKPWEQFKNAPDVCVHLAYVDGMGLAVRMISNETSLRATVNTPDGMVCTDSCMEAFIDFAPDSGKGYINFELNPLAALHEAIGTERNGRRFVRELGVSATHPITSVSPDGWEAMFVVTENHIAELFGKNGLSKGDVIKANFYCCADSKPEPFYATAFEIKTASPDYHRPEYFGELVIG